jgi:predicted nucleotidyltransferase
MDMDLWTRDWLEGVKAAFGEERIVCAGLQGSRARGEAGPDSDIDTVLILDRLEPADLAAYRNALEGLPLRELVCGFVSGREELRCWERGELFSFCRDTVPFLGSLDFAMELAEREDVRRSALGGACAVYHGCVHNLLHERSPKVLAELQKSAFFTLRVLCWLRGKGFPGKRAELVSLLNREERELLEGDPEELEFLSEKMLAWASRTIRRLGGEDGEDVLENLSEK